MSSAALRSEATVIRAAMAVLVPMAAALAQVSLAPAMTFAGVRPNLPVLVAGCWSIAAGAGEGVWWAFVGGLAADLLSSGPLGALTAASLPPVAAIGLGTRSSSRPVGVLPAAALVGAAVLGANLGYSGLAALAGQMLPSAPSVIADAIGGAFFSGALALAFYPAARIIRRLTEKRSTFG